MKKIIIVSAILLILAACAGGPKEMKTTTISISSTEIETKKIEVSNDSVSSIDVVMANLQKLPILPIGTKLVDVKHKLKRWGCSIVNESEQEIRAMGRKKIRQGNVTIEVQDRDIFIYTFKNGQLASGPNIYREVDNTKSE